jgi:Eph receptor B1
MEETFLSMGEGTNYRAYVVCEVDRTDVDNWLRTPFIGNTFTLYCKYTISYLKNVAMPIECTLRYNLQCAIVSNILVKRGVVKRHSHYFIMKLTMISVCCVVVVSAFSEHYLGDATRPAWNERTWVRVDRIAADRSRAATNAEQSRSIERRSVPVNKRGVYFAFRDQGACTSILSVKVLP